MRVSADAARAGRGQRPQPGRQPALLVEQGLGLVGAQPGFQRLQFLRPPGRVGQRNLVRAPGILHGMAVEPPRPGPAFRRAQHDHGPANPRRSAAARARGPGSPGFPPRTGPARVPSSGAWRADRRQPRNRGDSHAPRRRPAVPREGCAPAGRVGDLVAVQVQDGQHGAVARRVQEPGRLPGGGQRAGFGLAVPDHRGDDQVGIVEGRPKRVRQAVAQLTALVDRAGQLWRAVRTDAVRRRKCRNRCVMPASSCEHSG